jgi:hypothetical protein
METGMTSRLAAGIGACGTGWRASSICVARLSICGVHSAARACVTASLDRRVPYVAAWRR